jgi:hypothetical protein
MQNERSMSSELMDGALAFGGEATIAQLRMASNINSFINSFATFPGASGDGGSCPLGGKEARAGPGRQRGRDFSIQG